MVGINRKPFIGRVGNVKRTRRPVDGVIRNADGCVLLTVENKYKFEFIDPDTPVDDTIKGFDDYARLAHIPAFRFDGDDMVATASYLLRFDEYDVFKPFLETIRDKVFVDWEEDYIKWKALKTISKVANYTRPDFEDMTSDELSELIELIEATFGISMEIAGSGANGNVIKSDKVDALLGYFSNEGI